MSNRMVPFDPTPEMLEAARDALRTYIYALSVEERKKLYVKKRKMYIIPEKLKHTIRYQAMLDAAPKEVK